MRQTTQLLLMIPLDPLRVRKYLSYISIFDIKSVQANFLWCVRLLFKDSDITEAAGLMSVATALV